MGRCCHCALGVAGPNVWAFDAATGEWIWESNLWRRHEFNDGSIGGYTLSLQESVSDPVKYVDFGSTTGLYPRAAYPAQASSVKSYEVLYRVLDRADGSVIHERSFGIVNIDTAAVDILTGLNGDILASTATILPSIIRRLIVTGPTTQWHVGDRSGESTEVFLESITPQIMFLNPYNVTDGVQNYRFLMNADFAANDPPAATTKRKFRIPAYTPPPVGGVLGIPQPQVDIEWLPLETVEDLAVKLAAVPQITSATVTSSGTWPLESVDLQVTWVDSSLQFERTIVEGGWFRGGFVQWDITDDIINAFSNFSSAARKIWVDGSGRAIVTQGSSVTAYNAVTNFGSTSISPPVGRIWQGSFSIAGFSVPTVQVRAVMENRALVSLPSGKDPFDIYSEDPAPFLWDSPAYHVQWIDTATGDNVTPGFASGSTSRRISHQEPERLYFVEDDLTQVLTTGDGAPGIQQFRSFTIQGANTEGPEVDIEESGAAFPFGVTDGKLFSNGTSGHYLAWLNGKNDAEEGSPRIVVDTDLFRPHNVPNKGTGSYLTRYGDLDLTHRETFFRHLQPRYGYRWTGNEEWRYVALNSSGVVLQTTAWLPLDTDATELQDELNSVFGFWLDPFGSPRPHCFFWTVTGQATGRALWETDFISFLHTPTGGSSNASLVVGTAAQNNTLRVRIEIRHEAPTLKPEMYAFPWDDVGTLTWSQSVPRELPRVISGVSTRRAVPPKSLYAGVIINAGSTGRTGQYP